MTDTPGRGDVYRRVFDDLSDGVVVIERGGVVARINPAAARVLGVGPDEALGRSFAELFVAREDLDELTELVLGAVGDRGGGDRRMIVLETADGPRSLSVATSHVGSDAGDAPTAVAVVFSDLTELREMREAELRMARAVEEQHAELQVAYRRIQERNETLAVTLRQVQVTRVVATVLVIGVFLAAGAYAWKPLDRTGAAAGPSVAATEAESGGGPRTIRVEPQPVSETVTLRGVLRPWRTVAVASPVGSRVAAIHFRYGEAVTEGDLLVELDMADMVRRHRAARVRYLDATRKFETVRDWNGGPEVSSARRSLAQAEMRLEDLEGQVERSAFLLDRGLIPATEHASAERRLQAQRLDAEAARENLRVVLDRGDRAALDAAELELNSAREEMLELELHLGPGDVRAPVSGVVLAPEGPSPERLSVGQKVEPGGLLATIGDFGRVAATAKVDEIDVPRIAVGQPVVVSGAAFPGLTLDGTVTGVASQPDAGGAKGAPLFDVTVGIDALDEAHRGRLRVGMSSHLTIVVHHRDDALLVPLAAVERRDGSHWVRAVDETSGEVEDREVEIGSTTPRAVEVTAGLQAGDEIVVPER